MVEQHSQSEHFRVYVELLRQLHLLIAAGAGETPAADAIRDQMDQPWYAMSPAEIRRVRELSADLYSLSDEELLPADCSGRLASEDDLSSAWSNQRWDRVLDLLRLQPPFLTRDQIAFMRGYCWLMFGELEIARLFFEKAMELDAGNSSCRIMQAHVLVQLGRVEEAQSVVEGLAENPTGTTPLELLRVGGALFAAASKLSDLDRIPAETRISQLISNALKLFGDSGEIPPEEQSRYLVMLGICQDDLGNIRQAMDAFLQAALLDPGNTLAKDARDLLMSSSAKSEQKASNGTPSVRNRFREELRQFGAQEQRFLGNEPFPERPTVSPADGTRSKQLSS